MSHTRLQPDVDVAIIGAGISGIATAYYLSQIPGLSWIILDAKDDLGGTWDTFSYPGLRSDSDIDSYCFSFESWTGSRPLGTGTEIKDYLRHTATRHNITPRIRFSTTVSHAEFDTDSQMWTLHCHTDANSSEGSSTPSGAHTSANAGAPTTPTGEYTLTARFIHAAVGYYDHDESYQPALPGEENFGGTIVDPQFWPEGLSTAGADIAIVGSGATAVTLAPALAPAARSLTLVQRTVNHTAVMANSDPLKPLRSMLPEGGVDKLDRWRAIAVQTAALKLSALAPEQMKKALAKHRTAIIDESTHAQHFEAAYPLWTQRVCRVPDGDLFHAVAAGTIGVVTDTIEQVEERGIRMSSGEWVPADILIKATGLKLRALGGIQLAVDGEAIDPSGCTAWRGMCLDRVPNFSFTLGYVNDSFTLRAELVAKYLARMITHMRAHGHATFTPINPPSGKRHRIIDLQSGYVNRGIADFPSVTTTAPWTLYNDYLREVRDFRTTSPTTDIRFEQPLSPNPTERSVRTLGDCRVVTTTAGSIRVRHTPAETSSTPRIDATSTPSPTRLVCIHGIGCGLEDFDELTRRLPDTVEVLSLDIPGFGHTPALSSGSTMNALAAALWEAVDAVYGGDEPVVLVGHSLGGALVQRMLVERPARVKGLMLLAPSGFSTEITPVVRAAALPGLGEKLVGLSHPAVVKAQAKATVANESCLDEEYVSTLLSRAEHPDRAATFAALSRELCSAPAAQRMVPARRCALTVAEHGTPVSVVWGTEDGVLGIDQLDTLREVYAEAGADNPRVLTLPGCGHMLAIEQPDHIAAALAELLEH